MNAANEALRDEMKNFAFHYFDGKTVMKSDDLTVVIRGHLLVETFLERLLAQRMDLKEFEDHDLTFSRKIKMANGLGLLGDLYLPIKRLNKIRNDLAHNIQMKLQDVDISAVTEPFQKKYGDGPEWKAAGGRQKTSVGG